MTQMMSLRSVVPPTLSTFNSLKSLSYLYIPCTKSFVCGSSQSNFSTGSTVGIYPVRSNAVQLKYNFSKNIKSILTPDNTINTINAINKNAHSYNKTSNFHSWLDYTPKKYYSTSNNSNQLNNSSKKMSYTAVESGSPYTDSYRVFIKDSNGNAVSPFHDIPLYVNAEKTILNAVIEIPRWTNAKMEIDTKKPLNPIKQDTKNGKLRFVKNCFPHHGYIWNYGAFPQTWEDPSHITPETGAKGDNDPVDVLEIGETVAYRGQVKQVKVLGAMALLDEGETDWKVITIDVNDPLAAQLNNIDDVEKHMPGFLAATNNWFRVYKIPDGKPANNWAFDGKAIDKDAALKVVHETHDFWNKLVHKQVDGGSLCCTTTAVKDSPFNISADEANSLLKSQPAAGSAEPLPAGVDKWYYPVA